MTKILVIVEGNMLRGVYCTDVNAEVTYIDWDNIKEGPELELVEQNNYPVDYLDEMVLQEKLDEANDVIKQNIENDVEQRR